VANEAFLMSFHRDLIADGDTQSRFRAAIRRAVRPGDRVADLGSGTGIHALFACQAGASRVYAIESDRVVHLARAIAARNGFGDRIVFVEGTSPEVELPEKVDLLVANLGFDGTLRYLPDARQRFLEPGGKLIPRAMELTGAPVECAESHARDVGTWRRPCFELDLGPMADVAANTVHVARFEPRQLLARPETLLRLDLAQAGEPRVAAAAGYEVSRAGMLHGLATWYVQWLDDETSISLEPPLRLPYPLWHHSFFPVREPVAVRAGDRVSVEIRLASFGAAGTYLTWEVRVERAAGATVVSRHSTLEGTPLSPESLERGAPRHRPSLSSAGEAARTVLNLACDRVPLMKIERETHRRYPGLFPDVRDAAAFVSRVLGNFAA
jgi:precorrin-6B methylase 2